MTTQAISRPLRLDDLRDEFMRQNVPQGNHRWQTYERAKRVMLAWRDANTGRPMPAYIACACAVANWVGV